MKTFFLSLLFFIGSFYGTVAQVIEEEETQTSPELFDFHTKKKKQNFTVAFITLGGGTAMFLGGMSQNLDNCLFDDCNDGMPLAISGAIIGLSSIYFFERGFFHKKEAKFQLQSGAIGHNREVRYSGLSITIDL
ncbi:hypothetical protein E7Z59_02115 [Robertkochia marina]|uniref:Uncharacterized protein n=1 Tax=Robertkochia marina TaxID=1227945 RepID=A0A4S3M382_9FLAO|nr:hypothetical protein [Robertkochia marina]THD69149.1 hypothetical protein E7Z59_02115 [Robertkochia marina]TRZ47592.1 hypothetical protein D3A96_02485 [Robertkochia marina]